jgi:hypothetical protein
MPIVNCFMVFESGSGYGESFNLFTTKKKAMDHFVQVCNERCEFTDTDAAAQKVILDNEELQCDDGEVIKIVPLALN